MRTFGFIGNRSRSQSELQIPGARLARVNQSLKRRLDDDIEEIFSRACATNDLVSAADLLTLLEKWHLRRTTCSGRDRRNFGVNLQRARKELDRQTALRRNSVPSGPDLLSTPKSFGRRL
jgi:hypothetical protein